MLFVNYLRAVKSKLNPILDGLLALWILTQNTLPLPCGMLISTTRQRDEDVWLLCGSTIASKMTHFWNAAGANRPPPHL